MIDTLVYLLQLTAVASFTALVYLLGSRWLGRHSRKILLSGLLGVLGVTTIAWLPNYVLFDIPCPASARVAAKSKAPNSENFQEPATPANAASPSQSGTWPSQTMSQMLGKLFVAALTTVGLIALIRVGILLVGYYSMIRLLRCAHPVLDSKLRTVLYDVIQLDGSFRHCARLKKVRFVQSNEIVTAATLGTWKPVILLPVHWQNWSKQELSAVIAHELEHIRQADFLSRLISELVRAIHFYHPLVCWIANQFRIEQENTADLAATRYLSRELYEQLLVSEGFKPSGERRLGWAPSFSLKSKSLLRRRIEMLRKRLLHDEQNGKWLSWLVIACVMPLTIVLCGIHASGQEDEDASPTPSDGTQVEETTPDNDEFSFKIKLGTEFGFDNNADANDPTADQNRNDFTFSFTFPKSAPESADDAPSADDKEPSGWFTEFYFTWPSKESGK